jgi:hypothetical protein
MKSLLAVLLLLCLASMAYSQGTGPVAHYTFDGDANDSSGNGNHATVMGATLAPDRNGNPNSAYSFDGDDWIAADADGLPTADRTVAFWFYANQLTSRPVFFSYGGNPCGTTWWQGVNADAGLPANYILGVHCSLSALHPYTTPPVEKWYHWTATTSASGTKFFIDGVEVFSNSTYVNNTSVAGRDLSFGVATSPSGFAPYVDGNVGFLDGALDDIRVYDRVLSDQEICDLADVNWVTPGLVLLDSKISDTVGGFIGTLDDGDQFGSAVAGLGTLGAGGYKVAVGAARDDDGASNAGAVWILTVDSTCTVVGEQKISSTSGLFAGPLDDSDLFGNAVANLGDLNGQGSTVLAVGAPLDDAGASLSDDQGAVWNLFLDSTGQVASAVKIGPNSGGFTGLLAIDDQFGWDVDSIGDLNGDGVGDMAVGAIRDTVSPGPDYTGAVWIVFLDASGVAIGQQKINGAVGGPAGVLPQLSGQDFFGTAVAGLGDLDGPGSSVGAVAVGGLDDDQGGDAGAVWILFLDAQGSVTFSQKVIAPDVEPGNKFGTALTAVGDLDGDCIPDLVVGGHGTNSVEGAVWTLFLNRDGTIKSSMRISKGESGFGGSLDPNDQFGGAVDCMTGFTGFGDGVVTLIVGAIGDDDDDQSVPDAGNGAAWLLSLDGVVGVADAWSDEGCALPGNAGQPALVGCGDLTGGSSNSVDLSWANPNSVAGLFLALSSTPVPFKGGTLKPVPFLPPVFLTTSSTGTISIPFLMPLGIPSGTEIWVQWAIQDAAAVKGVALSNAILGVTP